MKGPPVGSAARGVPDLVALWQKLPLSAVLLPVPVPRAGVDVRAIADYLRTECWRAHCGNAAGPCIDGSGVCAGADRGGCLADALFPLYPGGSAPAWRTSTLRASWPTAAGQLRLLGIGANAVAQVPWACQLLQSRFGFGPHSRLPVTCFGDLVSAHSGVWRLDVRDWLLEEAALSAGRTVIKNKLVENLAARAVKLSALCSDAVTWQRLAGHLARHVSLELLPSAIKVRSVKLACQTPVEPAIDKGKGYRRVEAATLRIAVEEAGLPWLALLDVFGIGENVDKGYGQVDLCRLSA